MYSYLNIILLVFIDIVVGRDFYLGMYAKNDKLVARDLVFKEKVPMGYTIAKYGKRFSCPITYFRVSDRLGYGEGPKVQILHGGLQKKYIIAKLMHYNLPIAVNIHVGCAGTQQKPAKLKKDDNKEEEKEDNNKDGDDEDGDEEKKDGDDEESDDDNKEGEEDDKEEKDDKKEDGKDNAEGDAKGDAEGEAEREAKEDEKGEEKKDEKAEAEGEEKEAEAKIK